MRGILVTVQPFGFPVTESGHFWFCLRQKGRILCHNGFTYLSKHLELEGSEIGQRRPNLCGKSVVRCSVLVQIAGNLIEVAADLPILPGQPAHGGKQLVIDGGHGDDGLDRRAGDGLPDKFGLAHAIGGQALHEVGVFFLGHTGLDDAGAVGRVVAFGQ